MRYVVTGGAGFIGSHFVRNALAEGWADEVVVLDALTYAGNLENLQAVQGRPGFRFVRADVADATAGRAALAGGAHVLFHFSAESHVDRSIESAAGLLRTHVLGTPALLAVGRACGRRGFPHVST